MSSLRITKKKLEITLQKVPEMPEPSAEKEQYMTAATIAADVIFTAYSLGSVFKKRILDLGCGTAILGIGAALCGANFVICVDFEKNFLVIAKKFAEKMGLKNIDFIRADVTRFYLKLKKGEERFVTIQNPPFGSQFSSRRKDRLFLKKAFALSDEVYSLHNAKTKSFLEKFALENGFRCKLLKEYSFQIPHLFQFHKKEREWIKVGLFHFLPLRTTMFK